MLHCTIFATCHLRAYSYLPSYFSCVHFPLMQPSLQHLQHWFYIFINYHPLLQHVEQPILILKGWFFFLNLKHWHHSTYLYLLDTISSVFKELKLFMLSAASTSQQPEPCGCTAHVNVPGLLPSDIIFHLSILHCATQLKSLCECILTKLLHAVYPLSDS